MRLILNKFAERFGVDSDKLLKTLKNTVFKLKNDKTVTDEQLISLLIVADQYGLNPFTREIIAFVDKQGGVIPAVTVDGWCRIINNHSQFDGVEFFYSEDIVEIEEGARSCPAWCEAIIYRKDRSRPTRIREYLDEVYRPPFEGQKNGRKWKVDGPWQTHTKRMLRHKALIQCARVAFGFGGLYDEDEAARIVEARDQEMVVQQEQEALPQPQGVIIDMPQSQPEPEKIPVALLNQIEVRTKQQGVEMPELKSKEEAQSFLNELLQKKKQVQPQPQPSEEPQEFFNSTVEEGVEAEEAEIW